MMNNLKKRKKYFTCGILLAVLFITSCNMEIGLNDYKTFSYDLRGTWLSNDPSVYSGKLVIDSGQITITGFNEGQTPLWENDNKRPFKGFTKGTALKAYSEEGKIFIEDGGSPQEGISYIFYTAGIFPEEKFLRFTFGGRQEIMRRQ